MMKKESKQIRRYFSFGYDSLDTLEKYLEDMAEQGWMFVGYSGMLLTFEACEARKLNFAVEIFDKTSQFATFCNEENLEYIEYCERAGWKYISSFGVLQFFYSEDLELTPIETDDRMKWESIWKAGRPNRISIGLLLPACAVMQLFMLLLDPLDILLSYMTFANLIVWVGLLLNGAVFWIRTLLWRGRCLKSVEAGEGIVSQKHMTARQGFILLAGILGLWGGGGIVSAVITGDHSSIMIFVICILVILLFPVILWGRRLAVYFKLSPARNLLLQLGLGLSYSFWLTVVTVVSISVFSLRDVEEHREWKFTAKEAGSEKEISFTAPMDDIDFFVDAKGNLVEQPRTIEARKDTGYSTKKISEECFLLQQDFYSQSLIWDRLNDKQEKAFEGMFPTEGIYIYYERYQSPFAFAIDFTMWLGRRGRAAHGLDYPLRKAEKWGTEAAQGKGAVYVYFDETAVIEDEEDIEYYQYLFRTEHSIVKLSSSKELPAETIEGIYRRLS